MPIVNQDHSSDVLRERAREALRRQYDAMKVSRFSDWEWCAEGFGEGLDWLLNHPKNIRKGTYLTRTPDKEVWRCGLPTALGSYPIIYKYYDCNRSGLLDRLAVSNAVNEAVNTFALRRIGIPMSEVLACGEYRQLGLLNSAFLIARCAENTYDGSVLMPTGMLADNRALKLSFAAKAMKYLALAHRCSCLHGSYKAHKILFGVDADEDDMDVIWADVSTCRFVSPKMMRREIPMDMVRLFGDLRFSADESKKLCNEDLQDKPDGGYSGPTLWKA